MRIEIQSSAVKRNDDKEAEKHLGEIKKLERRLDKEKHEHEEYVKQIMGYNKELQGQIKTYEHQLEALAEETQMVANENE